MMGKDASTPLLANAANNGWDGSPNINAIEKHAGSVNAGGDGPPKETPKAMSLLSTAFIMCSMSLGVGVFVMPSVFSVVGFYVGVSLLIFFGIMSTCVALAMVSVADEVGALSINELCEKMFPGLSSCCSIAVILSCVIGNASHLQLVGAMLYDLDAFFITSEYGASIPSQTQRLFILLLFILLVMPYCFSKDISKLKKIGNLVCGTVLATAAVLIVSCFIEMGDGQGAYATSDGEHKLPDLPDKFVTVLQKMPTIAFAFTSLFTVMPVRLSLREKSSPAEARSKLIKATIISGIIQTTLYVCVSVVASLTFGTQAGRSYRGKANGAGNVLYNIPAHNYPMTILCFCLVIVITLDYPIVQFPAVDSALSFFPYQISSERAGPRVASVYDLLRNSYGRHIFTVIFAAVIIALDLFVQDLDSLFGLCGSLGISGYCYIIPGIILISTYKRSRGRALFGVALTATGLLMMTTGTAFIIKSLVES